MAGRPPKPDAERRDYVLRIRLADNEREAIEAAAVGEVSTWARGILLGAVGKKPVKSVDPKRRRT